MQPPPAKQLSQFDFAVITGINKNRVMALVQQRQWAH